MAICMCHEHVEGSETERLLLRPHACGIVYLLTSNSTGRRQHLSNAVLKLFYLTGASLNICRLNDSVVRFRSFNRKRNTNTLVHGWARDVKARDRDETETLTIFLDTRPRRDSGASRDRLDTETSRPRPQFCFSYSYSYSKP